MNMQFHEYLLLTVALGVVAADAIIRLRVAATRRDNYIEELLDVFASNEKRSATRNTAPEFPASDRESPIERNFA
jgi:hypothetical protein